MRPRRMIPASCHSPREPAINVHRCFGTRIIASNARRMQEYKERVALTSIAASGGLTVAKALVGALSGSLALHLGGGALGARFRRDRDDLVRGTRLRQAGRRGASLRPRQGRERRGADRDRAAVRSLGCRDLRGGEAAHRPGGPRRRGDARRLRGDHRLDRGGLPACPPALPGRDERPRARRSKPTRCISAPTCGPRSRC